MPPRSAYCAGRRTPSSTSCSPTAPCHGAGLLQALFPRSYVDPNRHEHEIDPQLLAEPWPQDLPLSPRADRGLGVVRRLVRADRPGL